jgi:hypothetical protein
MPPLYSVKNEEQKKILETFFKFDSIRQDGFILTDKKYYRQLKRLNKKKLLEYRTGSVIRQYIYDGYL